MLRSLTLFQLWTYLRAASMRALHVLVILSLIMPNLTGLAEAASPTVTAASGQYGERRVRQEHDAAAPAVSSLDDPTPTETATATLEATSTEVAVATDTATPTQTETATATLEATSTEVAVATDTAAPTQTPTEAPTATPTETASPIPTETASPTLTLTETPTATSTETASPTSTSSASASPTANSTVAPMTSALVTALAASSLSTSGRMLALAINSSGGGRVVASADFLSDVPTWTDITGAITGGLLVLRLDPSDPANSAFVLTTNGLWHTSNLKDNPPTWTNVLTTTQMRAATEGGASFSVVGSEGQMMMSPNDEGYVGLLVRGANVWFGRTSDAPGGASTWTWTTVAGSPYRGSTLWVSQHTTQRVYMIQVDGFPQPAKLRVSTDGGSTWTPYTTMGFWDGVPYMFIPDASNDSVIYIGAVRNPTTGTGVFRSVNGPDGPWVGITPSISGTPYAPNYSEAFTESPASNGSNLYLAGSSSSSNGANGASALFKWDGSSWTILQSAGDTTWVGRGLSGWPSNTSQLQVHNAGFGTGHVGYSMDGGTTWADHTGNLLTVAPGTVSVRYLAPNPTFELPPSQAFATNECPFCNNRAKVYTAGMGINAYSGNFNHQHGDGEVAGVGARLSFERAYNSLTTGNDTTFPTYNDVLGYGWTHNYNVRLILPTDPGGETGVVRLIAPRGSVLRFNDNGNGTYSPFPAVLATLTRTDLGGGVYEYHVVTNSQYEYVFNNDRRLVSIFDPQDHQTTLAYSGNQLTQVQDATGTRRLKFFYNGSGRIERVEYVKVQQPGNVETVLGQSTYAYDADGNLDSATDMNGRTWDYVYGTPSNHLLTKVVDPSLKTLVETTFDTSGRALLQTDGNGKRITEVLSYTGDSRQIRTDADDNNVTTTVSFSGGVPVSVTDPNNNDSQTTFVWPGINPGTITDPNSNATTLTWSADGGNLTQVQDALNNTTSMVYDSLNNLTQVTDDLGRKQAYTYTGTLLTSSIANYVDGIAGPGDEDLITTYTYTDGSTGEPAGLLRTQTDPRGIVIRYTYTPLGQRETVTVNYVDGAPGPGDDDLITSYTYDDRGRLVTVTDPLLRVTLNEYDTNGNLFRVTRNYVNGQPQNYQNTYNLITTYEYDSAGRLVKTTDTLNRVNHTCYDSAGRVVKTVQNPSVADPCVSYTPSTDPDKDRITTMTYDGDGNVIAAIGPDGVVTRTYYDELNRPIATIQNLAVPIDTPLASVPAWDSNNPDQNVRSDTVYDPAGNVIKTIDNTGRVTYTCYDALNRPIKTVQNPTTADPCVTYTADPAADKDITTQTVYDDVGNAIATIDWGGVITRTYYDPLNRPYVVVTNLFGQDISVSTPPTYNPAYPDQNIGTQTFYDEAGRVYRTLDLTTNRSDWTCYDDAGRVTRAVRNATVADPCVGAGTGLPLSAPHGTNNDENLSTDYLYDSAGRQIAVVAPDGVIARTYYDDADRRVAVVSNLVDWLIGDPNPPTYNPAFPDQNIVARYEYDALGRLVKAFDNGGLVSYSCYDALGRTVKTIQNPSVSDPCVTYTPSGNSDEDVIGQTTYDTKGDVIATTDPEGKIARTYYDALHRPRYVVENLTGQGVEVTTPPTYNPANPDQNVRQEMKYDDAGRTFETVDNASMVTRTNYDLLDRATAVIINYVDGPGDNQTNLTTQTYYDKRGNVTDRKDADDVVTHFDYDALGRLTVVRENYLPAVNPTVDINVRTEYTYDSHGNRLKIRDGNATLNNTQDFTTFTYDALDRPLTESDPLGHVTTHSYTLVGTPATLLDANSQTTTYAYDDLRRLTTIDYPTGTSDVTFAYDAVGNRLSMTDGAGTTNWTYDGLYRPTQIGATPWGGNVGYTYDLLGLRQSLTYPDTKSANYAFDGLNRLTGVTPVGSGLWAAGSTGYTYNAFGAMATETRPNGVNTTYGYDNAHRLTSIQHSTFSIQHSTFAYTLDKIGNRTAVTETVRQPPTPSVPDSLFADGFESGNLNGWSSNANGSGTLTATTAAALAGTYGMQAQINSTTARYVQDSQPNAESRYRARFYFDPNSITMASGNAHYIFYGYTGTSTVVLRVEFQCASAACPGAGSYQLRVAMSNDSTTFTNSGWVTIADAPHYVELDWQASTAAGANNGRVDWWIDGTQRTGVSGIDNDTRRIDQVRLGPVAGLDAGTTGTYYFDAFESRRLTQIGSGTSLPEAIFANDFESGNLNYWTSSTGSPTVTTAASLAPVGTYGMAVTLASATTAKYVTDSTPTYESRYRARFYFDPNSITMANNSNHVIFYGDSGTTAVLRLELQFASGNYQLRAGLTNDTTTFTNSSWVNIADAPHVIEIDWKASTAPGANNGSLNWWIDESQQAALSNIDNDTRRIDRVRLGAVAAVDATTNGTLYFDAFESRRSTYIGPMPSPVVTTTITYVYDPLYRLKEANYSDGRYFRYTYDAVGNRLTEEKCAVLPCGTPITNTYTYDSANRLTNVNGQTYQWDANGNLLNDGVSTYTYDAANRLTSVTQGTTLSSYSYNGLGDRLSQTVDSVTTNYVLDLNAGLTQVLADGTNTYLYGNGRIGELQPGGFAYHLGDALGSVRQLTDASGTVTLTRSFEPYGNTLSSAGNGSSVWQFTGEARDASGLTFLRARYFASNLGRFITKDAFSGNPRIPLSLNRYNYAHSNPLSYTDPSGNCILGVDCVIVAGVLILAAFLVAGCSDAPNFPTLTPISFDSNISYTENLIAAYRNLNIDLSDIDWSGIPPDKALSNTQDLVPIIEKASIQYDLPVGSKIGKAEFPNTIRMDENTPYGPLELGLPILGHEAHHLYLGEVAYLANPIDAERVAYLIQSRIWMHIRPSTQATPTPQWLLVNYENLDLPESPETIAIWLQGIYDTHEEALGITYGALDYQRKWIQERGYVEYSESGTTSPKQIRLRRR